MLTTILAFTLTACHKAPRMDTQNLETESDSLQETGADSKRDTELNESDSNDGEPTRWLGLDMDVGETCGFTEDRVFCQGRSGQVIDWSVQARQVRSGTTSVCALIGSEWQCRFGPDVAEYYTDVPKDATWADPDYLHTCGLLEGGVPWCIGLDVYGALSNLPEKGDVDQLVSEDFITCWRHRSGRMDCFGEVENFHEPPWETGVWRQASLGLFTVCLQGTEAWSCVEDRDDGEDRPSFEVPGEVMDLQVGWGWACWLDAGEVRCAGKTSRLQNTPTTKFAQLACGGVGCCALDAEGAVTCWGSVAIDEIALPRNL